MTKLLISDKSYMHLNTFIDHPYRRFEQQMYTGFGFSKGTNEETAITTSKGLAAFFNAFAKHPIARIHPSTYIDNRPLYIKQADPIYAHQSTRVYPYTYKLNALPATTPHTDTITSTTPTLYAAPNQPIPNAYGPYMQLVSPYPLDTFGEWLPEDLDAKPRTLGLLDATLEYLSTVAIWWRIPTRRMMLSQRGVSNSIMSSFGGSIHVQRAGMVLELIGDGQLQHPDLQPLPKERHRNRNDYKYKRVIAVHDTHGNRIG